MNSTNPGRISIKGVENAEKLIKAWQSGQEHFELMTSGSTGKPKKIIKSRDDILKSVELTTVTFGLNSKSHLFCCLNTKYVAGFMMIMRALVLNARITIVKPDSNPLKTIPKNSKFDFAAFVPIQLANLKEPEINILNSIKTIIVGGSEIHDTILLNINKIKTPVYQTYGMTETLTHIAKRRINGNKYEDFYTPLKNIKTAVDNRGCLVINSPMKNNEDIITNDIVKLRKDGSFKFLGRYDNVINSGGYKIHPEQTELKIKKLLAKNFNQLKVNILILGLTDKKLWEKAVLIVESFRDNNSKQIMNLNYDDIKKKIIQLCKDHLHPYEIPKEVFFTKKFIYTKTLKPDRAKMKEELKKILY